VASDERIRLRATFDEVAELYEQARPGYPAEVFDDLLALTGLAAGHRVLEIGCGTGQATRTLAERGLEVVCVELGANLAAVARRVLGGYERVRVVNEPFEGYVDREGFAAVTAFTAFHWLDPGSRCEQAASLLQPGGSLAVVETQHVLLPAGGGFWRAVQRDYDDLLGQRAGGPPPPAEAVPSLESEIEASHRFGPVEVRRYEWQVEHTADDYIAVLETYSGHRTMEPVVREELFRRIRQRIAEEPGERIRKTYAAALTVARLRG
jgi:SAM-dependent methyltransferase